jgi:glutamine---fructose-6-phosphate transaminase (isomerizing)
LTLDWHTSDYPELRPGPAWVMEEMIHAQAALPDGHLAACEPDSTRAVFFASDRRLGEPYLRRLALAAQATAEVGLPTTVIALPPKTVDAIELAASGDDSYDLLAGLLATAIALQWTALGLIDAAGTNPDLIRREQAPWRTAAAIADDGQAW